MPPELQRIVRLTSFAEEERLRPALRYWLSRPPSERVAAVEYLRRQIDDRGVSVHGVEGVGETGTRRKGKGNPPPPIGTPSRLRIRW